jgi:hypothetical protein
VPYNLFRLFLVHKISIYAFIYNNRKIKRRKGKRVLDSWARGDFGPAERGRTALRPNGPRRPTKRGNDAGEHRGRGPTHQREGGLTASAV